MAALELQDVWFEAGRSQILRGVSLGVEAGETVALLGPSGSGKTTLLRVTAGLDYPTSGKVFFEGRDVARVAPHRRGFGFMFQDHALFPHMDVAGNVEYGLRRAGWVTARRKERVRELMELVGLAGFEQRRIEKLSGGERQRVALARALAPEPRLLMLDEPLGSLDRGLRERLIDELREILARLAIPVIYVTHDQFEAFALADRVAILNEGTVVRTDTPREVWEHPQTEFVARFLGMENLVDGVRDTVGWVRTVFGTFGPLPGAEGKVRLLVPDEGARLVPAPGPNVASGTVESSTFRGAAMRVQIGNGSSSLEFSVPGDTLVPATGAVAHIRVGRVQTLDG